MQLFHFIFLVHPTASNPHAAEVDHAHAFIMVHSDTSKDEAEIAARSYVMEQQWLIESLEVGVACTPELLAEFEQPEASLVQRALNNGIAAYYSAAPKEERDHVEIRSLGKPPFSDRTRNH